MARRPRRDRQYPDGEVRREYLCNPTGGYEGCGKTAIDQRALDEHGCGTLSRPDQELPASRGDHGENDHEDDRVPGEPWCPGVSVSHQQGQCPAGEESGETADQDADPGTPPHPEKAARQPCHKQYRDQVPKMIEGASRLIDPGPGVPAARLGTQVHWDRVWFTCSPRVQVVAILAGARLL
jgi:hypothetical protein